MLSYFVVSGCLRCFYSEHLVTVTELLSVASDYRVCGRKLFQK